MANNVAIKWLKFGESPLEQELTPIRLELASERISIRELIKRAVTEQIKELFERQHIEAETVKMTLTRHYLTAKDVEIQAETGPIRMPSEYRQTECVSLDQEIANALRGFTAQAFRVVVDGVVMDSLDDEIVLKPKTKITFLRLTPLVGG